MPRSGTRNALDSEQRDLALALSAHLRGDLPGMAKVIAGHPDRTGLLSKSLALNMFFLRKMRNPQSILDELLTGDPLAEAVRQESATARARRFLLEQLAGGPVRAVVLRARALAEQPPIGDRTLDNAASQLGVRRGRQGDRMSTWSLPAPVPPKRSRG